MFSIKFYKVLLRMKKDADSYNIGDMVDSVLPISPKNMFLAIMIYAKFSRKYKRRKNIYPLFLSYVIDVAKANSSFYTPSLRAEIKNNEVYFYRDSSSALWNVSVTLPSYLSKQDGVKVEVGETPLTLCAHAKFESKEVMYKTLKEIVELTKNVGMNAFLRIVDSRIRISRNKGVRINYFSKKLASFFCRYYPNLIYNDSTKYVYISSEEDTVPLYIENTNAAGKFYDFKGNKVCADCVYIVECMKRKHIECPRFVVFRADHDFVLDYLKYFYSSGGGRK